MKFVQTSKISKKINKALKLHLFSKLPWLVKQNQKYETLPKPNLHQEEEDENALNEAIEARLMELIASSPQVDQPIKIKVTSSSSASVPANPEFLICQFPTLAVQTRCQTAEAQRV